MDGIDFAQIPQFTPDHRRKGGPVPASTYIDFTHSGQAAITIATTGLVRKTRFADVASAAPHLQPSDLFGMIGHNLDLPSRLHMHDYMECTYVVSGKLLLWVDSDVHVLSPGDCALIQAGIPHMVAPVIDRGGLAPQEVDTLVSTHLLQQCASLVTSESLPATPAAQLDVDSPAPASSPENGDWDMRFLIVPAGKVGLNSAMNRLVAAYCRDQCYALDYGVLSALCAFFACVQDALHGRTTDPLMDRIVTAIRADVVHASNQEVAQKVGYSVGYLSRYVKEHTGESLGALVHDIRLAHAATLLIDTNLVMSAVAAHSGFTSDSYFYRKFKDKYQMSPRRYRLAFRV